jgi:hypothetical protein
MAKHATLFFGAAFLAGRLVTRARGVLRTRGPWIGAAVAVAIFLPNVAWEVAHGWPTLEFMHNAQAEKMVSLGPFAFLSALTNTMLILTLPVWVGGLVWLFASKEGRPFAFLGVTFVGTVAIVVLAHGKPYYVAPVFPLAYAAGGVAAERVIRRMTLRIGVLALLAAGGAAVSPMALPVLEPETFIRYAHALHAEAAADEKHEMGPLPQFFADQFGWEEMARRVSGAYVALSPEDQKQALVYVRNYGEAGAMELFADRYPLPPVACGHNAYFMWGPPPQGRGAVLITLAQKGATLEESYEDVTKVGETYDPYAMPYENHKAILVARKPKVDLHAIWSETKHYI